MYPAIKSSGLPFTGRLEVSGNLLNGGSSGWEVLTVQPLWHGEAAQNHILTQLSWNYVENKKGYADGHTINGGLVYRHLSDDRSIVYGLNAFFDHAREMDHNRMSIGADAQTSMLSVSANKYFPLSDWKSVDAYSEERAAQGFDIELQGRLPQYPSWQANLRGYKWSSNLDMEHGKTVGYDAGLQWQPVNALIWDAGVRNERDSNPQFHTQMRLVYNFGDSLEKMWKRPVALSDVSDRVYDKVRRENTIRVEQRIKDSAYVRVQQTIGTNSAALADGTNVTLQTNLDLPRPFTVQVLAAGGSIARLVFRDGGVLTIGAGSEVRVEAQQITLISGSFQYVSGATNVIINVPGGTVTLLGTDVDVSSDGTTSVLRVRDGQAILAGIVSGSTTLNPGGAAGSVNGAAGAALATNDPVYINHTDEISAEIDRVAEPLLGSKVAPYAVDIPRLSAPAISTGQPVDLALKFNTIVSVTAPPQLVLDIGGNMRNAVYASGGGTDELIFTYILQAGDAGAILATVQSLDLNGGTITGNGKDAVITLADTIINLTGSGDVTVPSAYAVAFTTNPISAVNYTAASIQMSSAEIGTTYDYTITSNNGGTPVTGTGAVVSTTQSVTGIDLSGLADGTLTVSLTLTDAGSNVGPVVSDTALKDVITLTLDFVSDAYSLNGTTYGSFSAVPGASFTRASPATTYAEDSSGNLVAFAANVPRITDKGLLIEDNRTNFLRRSEEFNLWPINISSRITTIPLSSSGVRGAATMTKLQRTTNANSYIGQNYTGSATTSYTYSVYAKASELDYLAMRTQGSYPSRADATFDLVNGTVTSASTNFTGLNTSMQDMGGGIYRCSITFTTDGTGLGAMYLSPVDSATSRIDATITATSGGVYVDAAQLEEADFSSSYIPTANVAVTRDEDVAQVEGQSFVNVSAGTGYIDSNLGRAAFQLTGNSNFLDIIGAGNSGTVGFSRNSVGNILTNPSLAGGAKLAVAYGNGNSVAVLDGGAINTGGGGIPDYSANSRLWLGRGFNGSVYAYDYIRDFRYYPSALTDAQLQTLTTP